MKWKINMKYSYVYEIFSSNHIVFYTEKRFILNQFQ